MKKTFFTLSTTNSVPTINIDGYIGIDADYASFREALLRINDTGAKRMKLVINSGGGSIIEGNAFFDLVKSFNMIVEVEIIGMAASMAGVLSLLASPGLLGIRKHASEMTHRPQSGAYGESDNLREMANFSDKLEEKILKIYSDRTGKPVDEVKHWFKPGVDKWFTAEEAVEAGLADYIIEDNATVNKPTNFKNVKEAIGFYNSLSPKKDTNQNKMNKLLMSVVLLLNNNGIKTVNADSSEDDVVKAVNDFGAGLTTKISGFENSLKTLNTSRAQTLIAAAKANGKLPVDMKPEDETKWVNRAVENFDMVSEMFGDMPAAATAPAAPVATPLFDVNGQLDKSKPAPQNNAAADAVKSKADYTLSDWEQNDPNGLKVLMQTNMPEYRKLFKAQYGTEFPG